jgi:tetratricopeptide (TPR) repeat protein
MPPRIARRLAVAGFVALGMLAASACRTEPEDNAKPSGPSGPIASEPTKPAIAPATLKDEIPPESLEAVMAAHFRGLGLMEQYEYARAVEHFRKVHEVAPGWIPGSINLAIALLNDSGMKEEAAKKSGGGAPPPTNFDEALTLLGGVLDREPDNPYAHFSRGVILMDQGNLAEAHRHFKRVTEIDPNDAAAWFWMGSSAADNANPLAPGGQEQAKAQIAIFKKALELNPYLTPAIYKLAFAYRYGGQQDKQRALLDQWKKMDPERLAPVPGPGDLAGKKYGEMGKYASIVDPFARPGGDTRPASPPLRYEAARALAVTLGAGVRWAKASDFTGPHALAGRVRARFGAAVAAFDADGDGRLDLYLASAVVGPRGLRDILLVNKGDGQFEDASTSFGLPEDRASLGVATGDFDADRHIDVFLTGLAGNRLLRNRDGARFEDISSKLPPAGPPALSLAARWVDLDQDGDLDLYVVNYCAAELAAKAFDPSQLPPAGIANTVYRNDGEPDPTSAQTPEGRAPAATAYDAERVKVGLTVALAPWTTSPALLGGARPHCGIALLDLENDRDLDVVLACDGAPPVAVLNDRLGRFHETTLRGPSAVPGASGLLVTDFDADSRADLVATTATGPVHAWRNITERTTDDATEIRLEDWPINVSRWRAAQAVDLDLDGLADLLGVPVEPDKPSDTALPAWARNEARRFASATLSLGLESPRVDGVLAVDLVGDELPDLLVTRPGEPPALARNLGNGQHWLALRLGGHWRVKPQLMRTNSHAIGTRIVVEGRGVHATYDHTTTESGLAQSVAPVVLGIGRNENVDLVHLRWPDGVIQCELSLKADAKIDLKENNRKTGSCPVLFTWNGERYVCIGDFLGGAGLGYLVVPGVYSQPDRDEAVAIADDQLRPVDGLLRISVTEPMDEIAYVDHLKLEVVDRPPGVSTTPDERFAPQGPRPTGEVIAWRTPIEPVRATDLKGRDQTEVLRHWDRRTADTFAKRTEWVGYAEEHGIVLDFGDRLSGFSPTDPLVLCLAGWVEYPYSQTNYAAATAGVALEAPTIERRGGDGRWEVIEPHAGYPAGMPRLMTIDLTGKLTGPNCVLRIRTNMECYYDQAFVAVRDRAAERSLRVTRLDVGRAELGHRGYTREVSPDGRQPLLYDYDYVDPAPLACFSGKLTRYGDVADLLRSDDDRLCVVGPGDEVKIEFDAHALPSLPEGWTRSYVLRSYGYCKDADPFTAISDTVQPLPWRGMPAFPFGRDVKRPADPAYEAYLRIYQTRPAGGGAQ